MIEAIKGQNGEEQAYCACDDCGASVHVAAPHGNRSSFFRGPNRGGTFTPTLANEGRVHVKLQGMGWSIIKRRLRCGDCTEKRKGKAEVVEMTANTHDIRRPTREQKRQIIELLGDVYDTAAERYKGGETDVTVASAIGSGCMFGWVAEIREELFGPEGVNEEAQAVIAELRDWQDNAASMLTKTQEAIAELEKAREKVTTFQKRLDAIVKSHGPRAKLSTG